MLNEKYIIVLVHEVQDISYSLINLDKRPSRRLLMFTSHLSLPLGISLLPCSMARVHHTKERWRFETRLCRNIVDLLSIGDRWPCLSILFSLPTFQFIFSNVLALLVQTISPSRYLAPPGVVFLSWNALFVGFILGDVFQMFLLFPKYHLFLFLSEHYFEKSK